METINNDLTNKDIRNFTKDGVRGLVSRGPVDSDVLTQQQELVANSTATPERRRARGISIGIVALALSFFSFSNRNVEGMKLDELDIMDYKFSEQLSEYKENVFADQVVSAYYGLDRSSNNPDELHVWVSFDESDIINRLNGNRLNIERNYVKYSSMDAVKELSNVNLTSAWYENTVLTATDGTTSTSLVRVDRTVLIPQKDVDELKAVAMITNKMNDRFETFFKVDYEYSEEGDTAYPLEAVLVRNKDGKIFIEQTEFGNHYTHYFASRAQGLFGLLTSGYQVDSRHGDANPLPAIVRNFQPVVRNIE